MASPRNSSAMLAASMAIGGGTGRGGVGVGLRLPAGSEMSGETAAGLDAAGESEADRLRKKRQAIFRSKFEADEKIVTRNKALIALVKSLGRTNLRQEEELASLKAKVTQLEAQLERLRPLEALMAYMQESPDDRVLALLSADGDMPTTAAAPALPASEVMHKLVNLLQTCGEGVDDLGPDILQSEARACDMAAAGDEGWVGAMESAEREREGQNGDSTFRRVHRAPGADEADGEGDAAHESMGFGVEDDDAFAAEIAAVGTQLQQVCTQCGETFTEHSNSDLACRWHPGIKKVDAAWNSVWSCCGQRHAMKGCSVGRHLPSLDGDAESEGDSGL
jgi:hypothetical protein